MKKTKIVLVHGLSIQFRRASIVPGKERMKVLVEEIEKEFSGKEVKVIVPEYLEKYERGLFSIRKTIPEYAKVVSELVKKGGDNEPIILVGQSMGCLVVRWAVEKTGIQAKAVILVGAPNRGIKMLWWEKLLQGVIRAPCVEDMRKPSKFLCDILEVPPKNYYHIVGTLDTRVPLNLSIPGLADYMKNEGQSGRVFALACTHSRLIPKSEKYIENSAISAILKILKKEINK